MKLSVLFGNWMVVVSCWLLHLAGFTRLLFVFVDSLSKILFGKFSYWLFEDGNHGEEKVSKVH